MGEQGKATDPTGRAALPHPIHMEYFGEPANFSANNWLDNQHLLSSVCQNGS